MRVERSFYYDELGNEIHEGDLLRVYHFRGSRKRKYYMYHIAIKENWDKDGVWWAAKDYYREGNKGHYRLCAIANEDTGIIRGTRVVARKRWDETFKIN